MKTDEVETKVKPVYRREGPRIVLVSKVGPIVVAMASDANWADIIVNKLNK